MEIWDAIYKQLKQLLPRAPRVTLEITKKLRTEPRNFADILLEAHPVELRIHPQLLEPPLDRQRGVLAHEAGHLADHLLGEDGYELFCRETELPFLKHPELRADQLAEIITGWHIYYDPEDLVQRAGPTARGLWKRPRSLL